MADTEFKGELTNASILINPFFGTGIARDNSHDNMDYTDDYRALTGNSLSAYAALNPAAALNQRLDDLYAFIGGEISLSEVEEDADAYDPLNDVDYIVEDKEVAHALDMQRYTRMLLKASFEVDDYARKTGQNGRIGWAYKASRSMVKDDDGVARLVEGVDALSVYKKTQNAFTFDETLKGSETRLTYGSDGFEWTCVFGKERCSVEELNSLAVTSIITSEPDVRENASVDFCGGRNHYRPVHWMAGDGVEIRDEHLQTVRGAGLFNIVEPRKLSRMGVKEFVPVAFVYEENGLFLVKPVEKKLVAIKKSGRGMSEHAGRATKMSSDVELIMSVLTSEPQFSVEIAEKTGLTARKVGNVMKTALSAGLGIQSKNVKNAHGDVRPVFFI